ncbi:MAG: type II CRISPR RNA-guided endonuclease Cas9, partial [Burkholderiales bacterium]
ELWRQQNGRCVYCDRAILPSQLVATDNSVQVDHILPWSRFGDDSFNNKTLCTANCNQEKRGRTPFEWFSKEKTEAGWDVYAATVQALPALKGYKRRNYTIKNAKELEEKFRSRNLNDTRWTCRLLAEALKTMYPAGEGQRRVFTRPGALTDRMRRGWGLQWMKKDEKGNRIPDDRHHALDAIVVAATTEGMMQRLTKAFQEEEAKGSPRDFRALDQPWPGFREEAMAMVEKVFVSRAERRRARGKAVDATIKQVRNIDGKDVVFIRKPIAKLSENDLDLIPVPEPHGKVADPAKLRGQMIETLRSWILAEKPTDPDRLPRAPNGAVIQKVRVATKDKLGVAIGNSTADRGEMARVDVFRKQNKKGTPNYFLIPVYPHQIASDEKAPTRAVLAAKPEDQWPDMDDGADFLWSIGSMNYLEVVKGNGEVVEGYFRGLDRATGNIATSHHANSDEVTRGVGVKTVASFRKLIVDRLGRKFEAQGEQRTWRGKACT